MPDRIGAVAVEAGKLRALAFENGLGGVALRQVCGWEF